MCLFPVGPVPYRSCLLYIFATAPYRSCLLYIFATAPYRSCLLCVICYSTIQKLSTLCYLLQHHTEVVYFMLFATAPYRSCLLYVICYSTIQELSTLYVSFYHTVDSYLNALQYFRCRIKSKIFFFIWSRLFNLYLRINY